MTILKIATASLLMTAAFVTPVRADLLGSVGKAVGNTVGNVASGVSNVADRAVSGGSQGGLADVSVSASAGVSEKGINANASARAGVAGIAGVSACAGVNSAAGCGDAPAATAGTVPVPRSAASTPSAKPGLAEPQGAPALNIAPDWLIGMVAIGSDGTVLGRINKVNTAKQDTMPTITVQLDNARKVQLRNAISAIDGRGVWLTVPAKMVDDRATGRMTRLAIR